MDQKVIVFVRAKMPPKLILPRKKFALVFVFLFLSLNIMTPPLSFFTAPLSYHLLAPTV